MRNIGLSWLPSVGRVFCDLAGDVDCVTVLALDVFAGELLRSSGPEVSMAGRLSLNDDEQNDELVVVVVTLLVVEHCVCEVDTDVWWWVVVC